jgi:hypothetical protein
MIESDYSFTPKQAEGRGKPLHCDTECFGKNLTQYAIDYNGNEARLNLTWLIKAYEQLKSEEKFFNNFFVKLSGTKDLQQQIENGLSEEEIRECWKEGIEEYKKIRSKYLLYEDF